MNSLILSITLLLLLPNNVSAQDAMLKLNQNPFSKADIFKYKPPVIKLKQKKKKTKKRAKKPAYKFTLTATLISNNNPMAVVNNKLIALSQTVDGIKLLAVSESKARIQYKKYNYNLKITPPDFGKTGSQYSLKIQ